MEDIEELVLIDKRIDEAEANAAENRRESLRQRWEFGRRMLAARAGKAKLPNGYRAALVEATGKSQTELQYRAQFAERYPDEDQLFNALNNYGSWFQVTQSLSTPVIADDDQDTDEVEAEPEESDDDSPREDPRWHEESYLIKALQLQLQRMCTKDRVEHYSPEAKQLMINTLRRFLTKLEKTP